ALRSISVTLLSGTTFFGSAGSILVAALTRAMDSSCATATLDGGPTTLAGALTLPIIFGGELFRSMIVTESGGGFCTTVVAPPASAAWLSLADRASCATAETESNGRVRSASVLPRGRRLMISSPARIAFSRGHRAEPRRPRLGSTPARRRSSGGRQGLR